MKVIYFISSALGAGLAVLVLRLFSGIGGVDMGLRDALVLVVLTAVFGTLIGWALGSRTRS